MRTIVQQGSLDTSEAVFQEVDACPSGGTGQARGAPVSGSAPKQPQEDQHIFDPGGIPTVYPGYSGEE